MSVQKYNKGDRVKVIIGHPILAINGDGKSDLVDTMPELTKDIATVEYTYGEMSETDNRFSKGDGGYKRYSLNFDKYGSISWFNESVIIPVK